MIRKVGKNKSLKDLGVKAGKPKSEALKAPSAEWFSLLKFVVTRMEGMGYASDSPEALNLLALLQGVKEAARTLEEAGVPNALNVGAELLQSRLQELGLRKRALSGARCQTAGYSAS
jgi:hypothetical protein